MAVNEMQQRAIDHINGPMMVIAGPGSGKTFTITRRIENLIKNGIDPASILVITFTKASAMEMQQRFVSLVKDEFSPVSFGTFHAIYFGILKEECGYDSSCIITAKEKNSIMKRVLEYLDYGEYSEAIIPKLLTDIGLIKNDGLNAESFNGAYISPQEFTLVFKEYEKQKNLENKLDFEDMVLKCRDILLNNEAVLAKWRERYKYILIDEFQDINPMQYQVIKLIASPLNNLFIVGDDDQSIYGFRGSRPEIMLGFEKEYKDVVKVVLSVNYRSTEKIVNKAVSFIGHNKARFTKKLLAFNQAGTECSILSFDAKEKEYMHIIRLVKTIKRTTNYSSIALLFRTNSHARLLTSVFAENNIPFVFKEKPQNVFETEAGKDVIAYLRCIYGPVKRTDFIRIMNKPGRYIKRDFVHSDIVDLNELVHNMKIPKYVRENIWQLYNSLKRMKNMNVFAAVNFLYKGIGYEKYILDRCHKNGKAYDEEKENLNIILESARSKASFEDFFDYIDNYESIMRTVDKEPTGDAVIFSTMHGSKGLEYETVIIPDVNEGNIPSGRALSDNQLEEERRVFYVAMTRAKKKLYIMYLESSKDQRISKSRFIGELESE